MVNPPLSEQELQQNATSLAGKSLLQLAEMMQETPPQDLKKQKGWCGQFIERCLGADGGNLPQPDFSALGIELKTLPISEAGLVQESTYVSVVNLKGALGQKWRESVVYQKLKQVLWVPIAHIKGQDLLKSRIATPFLWRMNPAQEAMLQQDWEAVMDKVSLGEIHHVSARMGEAMQVRPKAAHSRVITETINEQGEMDQTLPRGFYLRSRFTQGLLDAALKR